VQTKEHGLKQPSEKRSEPWQSRSDCKAIFTTHASNGLRKIDFTRASRPNALTES